MFDNNFANRTARSNLQPERPYYYVNANLDLSGMVNGDTLYFNRDNSTAYLNDRFYNRFITIDENCIIGDVLIRTEPYIQTFAETANGPLFTIGGAETIETPVVVPYAASSGFGPKIPPQFSGASLRTNQMNTNPNNYFGHTAARFPYGQDNSGNPNTNTKYKFLAITLTNPDQSLGTAIVEFGTIYVTLKVYPKIFTR